MAWSAMGRGYKSKIEKRIIAFAHDGNRKGHRGE